nr:kynureninase [Ningiella ruwaisensis]
MTDITTIQMLKSKALTLDKNDPLAPFKQHFTLPENTIYLDGNSLGPLPKIAKKRAQEVVEQQWGEDLITSWNKHQWIKLPQQTGAKIAPLLGAAPENVIVCDSISVNLTKVLCAALAIQEHSHRLSQSKHASTETSSRTLVLSQKDNFPTDLYMVQGLSDLLGRARCELLSVDEQALIDTIKSRGHEIAVLILTQVNFRSGRVHDIKQLSELAQAHGILVVWDLAHSAGALELELDEWNVDFALGCTYKFLNGGPGAPAFIYAAKKHHHQIKQPVSGWMGHKRPFEFSHDYEPADALNSFLAGTPPVVSMSILDAALSVFDGISSSQLRQKSVALSTLFLEAFEYLIEDPKFKLVSPTNAEERGAQLAFSHPQSYAICQALIAKGVIADFRAPDILRFGFSPLFLSYKQMLEAIKCLQAIMQNKSYLLEEFQVKQAVT